MDQLCSLPWCRKPISSKKKDNRRFPSDRPSQLAWLDALDAGIWFSIPPETLSTGLILCGSHFDSDGNVKRRYETSEPEPEPGSPRSAMANVKVELEELQEDSEDEIEDGYFDTGNNDNYNNSDDPDYESCKRRSKAKTSTRKRKIRVNIVNDDNCDRRRKRSKVKKRKILSDSEEQDNDNDNDPLDLLPTPGSSKTKRSSLNSFDSDKLVRMTQEAFKSGRKPKEKGEPAKRMSMSLLEKMEIIRLSDRGLKQSQIARKLDVKKSTVWSVIANREKVEENYHGGALLCRKVRKGTFDDVNQILYAWYQKVTSQNLFVNTKVLMTMAENIAQELGRTDFKGSQGWLDRFKQRYNIRFGTAQQKARPKKKVGNETTIQDTENADGDVVDSIVEECLEDERVVKAKEWLKHIWTECRIKNLKTNEPYSEKDVFFAEEIGILYRITPKTAWQFRSGCEDLPEFSVSDERLTVLMCSNADGSEKRKLLVTGGDITEVPANLPVDYSITSDSSNWVTKPMFIRWLKDWNESLRAGRRKIVLVLSGAPIHLIKGKMSNITLAHIPIHHLAVLQPANLGITRNFRARYRRLLLERLVSTGTAGGSVNCREALFLLNTAWNELPPNLIKMAFVKAGFFPGDAVAVQTPNIEDMDGVDCGHLLAKAVEMGIAMPQTKYSFLDYVAIDENLYAMECSVAGILGESHPEENEVEGETGTGVIEVQEDDDINEPVRNEVEYARVSCSLTANEAHNHLVSLRNWAMSRKSCPLQVHNALSTLESFILGHH